MSLLQALRFSSHCSLTQLDRRQMNNKNQRALPLLLSKRIQLGTLLNLVLIIKTKEEQYNSKRRKGQG
ncbi:hypothetical protein FGO68_gene12407 [Halteria grandinella]|uniref:Uncharacterized protein n=1 Tax=Halteria grandinella TaxID=5974 RepID=A0A8J8P302_HALGN|nr:hypothetical protein FGO68_gene12407 [Halteria grandinella]